MAESIIWTREELKACVIAYKLLLDDELAGLTINKSKVRREVVAGPLATRSEGAYEFRMQNISSVLMDLGMPRINGYLPMSNIGSGKAMLVELINEIWNRQGEPETPTYNQQQLETRVLAARVKLRSTNGAPPAPISKPSKPPAQIIVARFMRDPNVIAWVLEVAGKHCEVCSEPAPFSRIDGTPFLEVHHVRPLAEGGPDTIENAVACCPNCHRRLHHAADREAVRRNTIRTIARLKDFPKTVLSVYSTTSSSSTDAADTISGKA